MILRIQRSLGNIAYIKSDYVEAKHYYWDSLVTSKAMGNRWGIAAGFRSLGYTACQLGAFPEAQAHFHEALKTATEIHNVPETLNVLAGIAELFAQQNQLERAVELNALVLYHPLSAQDTKDRTESVKPTDRAKRLQADLEANLPHAMFTAAHERGTAHDLDTIVTALLTDLSQPFRDAMPVQPTPTAQGLPDPLTVRELEILRLLAEGLSNREIAEQLVLALGTVKWYVGEIYSKLHVASRTQAIARARGLKLLP
jgi:ATP/maltotriose-dependent transcriptional regulator MalT